MRALCLLRLRRAQCTRHCTRASTSAPSATAAADAPADTPRIKMLPRELHERIFGTPPPANYVEDEEARAWAARIEMPPLRASSALGHIETVARDRFAPYARLLDTALAVGGAAGTRQPPSSWRLAAGWTRYDTDGNAEAVYAPDESLLFFDIEVCVSESQLPTLAVALSPTHWYSWCSERLVHDTPPPALTRLDHCIPLRRGDESSEERARPQIVIGHNVGYDRSRVREQLELEACGTRFWDTMSMNIAVQGMAEHQINLYDARDIKEKAPWVNEWRRRVCKNSLVDVYTKLNPSASRELVDKTMRDAFVNENMAYIRDNVQALISYCAKDVLLTATIFAQLYPQFCERFPSSITSAGMLTMASAYLPITANWRHFKHCTQRDVEALDDESTRIVARAADDLVARLSADTYNYRDDPWSWVSDWKEASRGYAPRPAWQVAIFTKKPHALKALDTLKSGDIKLKSNEIARLFGLCYGPYPLFYKRDLGWGYIGAAVDANAHNDEAVEAGDDDDQHYEVQLRAGGAARMPLARIHALIAANKARGIAEVGVPGEQAGSVGPLPFYQLPHPAREGQSVGSPFSKDYMALFESGKLWATRYADELAKFLDARTHTRFWGNYSARYSEQVTAWYDEAATRGAIAPAIAPAGTITRRAVHKLWLVSTNANEVQIGSQLKSMVECPPGTRLVGADVDSQEQWIAAICGDALTGGGRAGATPFSRMQVAGAKSAGTDLHSVVATTVGISRSHAKTLNYARLYGSGQPHAAEFLRQQRLPAEEAYETAERLFVTTKGRKRNYLELDATLNAYFERFIAAAPADASIGEYLHLECRYFLPFAMKRHFEDWLRAELARKGRAVAGGDFERHIYANWPSVITLYTDGIESATFNFLELRARDAQPRTPVLGCRLTRALEPLPAATPDADKFFQRYKRTIINWLVQSSAVDFLHMLLVCVEWMCAHYAIKARFVISVHDEVRYLVADADRYRAALALNVSNLLVRAAISEKLGIREMPMSIAFFSQVDIDTILRKEVDLPTRMPDGELVKPGEAITMKELLERNTCMDTRAD